MFDNLITNKYLIIALGIALVVLLFMYSQKSQCGSENMEPINISTLSKNTSRRFEKPWVDDNNDEIYKKFNNDFDKKTDDETLHSSKILKEKDKIYKEQTNKKLSSPYRCICKRDNKEFKFDIEN